MRNSVLEITEQEYLIKLDKSEFDLSFIHSLLKRIQSEQTFFKRIFDDEEDMIARRSYNDDLDVDHLSEK
ncbi:hypothetical protein [Pedobacter cryophilus]|uniref:Uncharacterized protein n=1 Tax=Pedobacter cryophilus TaxID=2571271 RepID=A0A4V5NXF8_9SPHI|nr:hypothetical protein [Pedobacter cryophilus]TKB99033.1 hypothetical protein FA046_07930 [Pedobacter cryophilus]